MAERLIDRNLAISNTYPAGRMSGKMYSCPLLQCYPDNMFHYPYHSVPFVSLHSVRSVNQLAKFYKGKRRRDLLPENSARLN